MLVTAADAPRHETPNAVMRTLAAPSLGSRELAVWEVAMRPGAAGPEHDTDREQVWTVLEGELHVAIGGDTVVVAAGEALRIPAGVPRRVAAVSDARAVVASTAGVRVTTPDGGSRPLPWAA
jgi:quercetin dioxygenase-like cupin family protein